MPRGTLSRCAQRCVAGTLAAIIEACKPGAKVLEICEKGDNLITE